MIINAGGLRSKQYKLTLCYFGLKSTITKSTIFKRAVLINLHHYELAIFFNNWH